MRFRAFERRLRMVLGATSQKAAFEGGGADRGAELAAYHPWQPNRIAPYRWEAQGAVAQRVACTGRP